MRESATNEDMKFLCPVCGKVDTSRRNKSIIEAHRRGATINDIARTFKMVPTYIQQIIRSARTENIERLARRDRNYAMYMAWYKGARIKDVAEQFGLSYSRTGCIIKSLARREGYRLPAELRQKLIK